MTTKQKHVAYTGQVLVGFADVGERGQPGSGASRIRCWLRLSNRGRWIAESGYSTGCNQGYYQENYGYGPWEGRGDTPDEAISAMLGRVDSEYAADIRKAAHDAKLDAEDSFGDWQDCTWAEVAIFHHESLLGSEKRTYCPLDRSCSQDDIDAWREAEIARLQKKTQSKLSHISDDELLVECRLRGLIEDKLC